MAQKINTTYQALDTSTLHNERFIGVVKSGVYSGYYVRPNAGAPNVLDIIPGYDNTSVLITKEGIRVEEVGSVLAAVSVASADANLTRYDLVVAEYQYGMSGLAEQVYKVIKGKNQANIDTDPVRPVVENDYQIPLAYIKIRPRSNYSSSFAAQVLTTDVFHIPGAELVTGPNDISALKPVISPIDDRRIYVYEGTTTSANGLTLFRFAGGYSAVIEDSSISNNTELYYMFGLTDAGDIEVIGSASTVAGLPELDSSYFPLAVVKAKKVLGAIRFQSLEDIRIGFSRRLDTSDRELSYKSLLGTSIFKYMRVVDFTGEDGINLETIKLQTSGASDYLSAYVDGADGALTIEWTGTSLPTENVVITTTDLMSGGNMGLIKHFMLVVDTTIDNFTFQYSSASSAFSDTALTNSLNKVIRIANTGARKIYLRFIVPPSAFAGTTIVKISSFAVLMQIDDAAYNTVSISELGIDSLQQSVSNLIANGDFYRWSIRDVNDNIPDLSTQETLEFRCNNTNTLLADGWQMTTSSAVPAEELVRRIIRASTQNSSDTALEVTTSTSTGTMVLEYRIPAAAELAGKQITFAVNFDSEAPQTIIVGVALFSRTANGMEVQDKSQVTTTNSSGELLVVSPTISSITDQIGFYIAIASTGASVTHKFYHARAAVGIYPKLEYSKVVEASSVLRAYYERGRVFAAQNGIAGNTLGTAIQFGTSKNVELGDLVVQTVPLSAANRSLNVEDLVYDGNSEGFVVTSTSTGSGLVTIDADWEAYVKYKGTVS